MVNNMWIIYALVSSIFSGLTSILASYSSKLNKVDSILITTTRTFIILIISFISTIFFGKLSQITTLSLKTIIFLILSGVSTTLLWIFYFKALDTGDVSKVTPIDKTSIVLTLILSMIFLHEKITIIKIISITLILIGTLLTVNKKTTNEKDNKWILYSVLTAIFTSTTTIISKIGLDNIDSVLATFIRTVIVFIILMFIVIFKKKYVYLKDISKKSMKYVIYSGITNTLSWLFYFASLKDGETSIVFTIEKLSIVVTILLSVIFLKEKLNRKQIIGIIIIVIATSLLMFT